MSDFAGVVSLRGLPIDPQWEVALGKPFHGRRHDEYRDGTAWLLQVEADANNRTATTPDEAVSRRSDLQVVGDLRVDHVDVAQDDLSIQAVDRDRVLALFAEDPIAFPTRLTGDFAAVIWDASGKALVGVRDHFGVHPFYYVWQDGLLFFSSDIRSLTAIGPQYRNLDLLRVAQFLEGEPTDEERTFYSAIKRLPRASRMDVSSDGLRIQSFWSTADIANRSTSGSEEELVRRFRDVFCDAVNCRLSANGVTGSLLSGGLDSSSVTCTARELMEPSRPLVALSAVFPSLAEPYRSQIDESIFVDAVCEIDGILSFRLEADRLTPLSGLDDILSIHGQPVEPPNAYLDYAMCSLAADHGVRVLLDGLEGDITISHGIHFLDELAERGEWSRFLLEGERLDHRLGLNRDAVFRRYGLQHLTVANTAKFAKGLGTLFLSGRFGMAARGVKARLRRRTPDGQSGARTLVSEELAAEIDWRNRSRPSSPESYSSERTAHEAFLGKSYIPSIMEFTHANSRHFGIDVRHPMFDRRIVDLAVRMPPSLKLKDGWTRYVLRAAMSGIVPDTVRWRPGKSTLAPNFDLKMSQEAREPSAAILFDSEALISDFVDLESLKARSDRGHYRIIWPAVVLASFLSKKNFED